MMRNTLFLVVTLAAAGCTGGSGGLLVSSEDPPVDPYRITRTLSTLGSTGAVENGLGVAESAFQDARLEPLPEVSEGASYRAGFLAGKSPFLRDEVLLAGASLSDREAMAVLAEVARVASARSRRRATPGRTILFSLWDGGVGYRRLRNHPLVSSSSVVGEIVIPGMDDGSVSSLERAATAWLDSLEQASYTPDSLLAP